MIISHLIVYMFTRVFATKPSSSGFELLKFFCFFFFSQTSRWLLPFTQPHRSSPRVLVSSSHHLPFEIYFPGENNICGMKKETYNQKIFQGWLQVQPALAKIHEAESQSQPWWTVREGWSTGTHWGMSCTLTVMLNPKLCKNQWLPLAKLSYLFPEERTFCGVLNMEISLVSSTASPFFSTFMHCYLFLSFLLMLHNLLGWSHSHQQL